MKKRILSGVQPTGELHLGNYLGALKLWKKLQYNYDSFFCIVDLHALTIPENIKNENIHLKSRQITALYLACGIDPNISNIFIQSHIKEHAELCWILNSITPVSWLNKMNQYKSKSKTTESINSALLNYPILQAADILLYKTNLVPVGEDQIQHIELTRNIANKFNNTYGETFTIPEYSINKDSSRIMGLNNPNIKMSKSVKTKGHSISLLDDKDLIKKTIMSSLTDKNNTINFHNSSQGIINLLNIYKGFTEKSKKEIEEEFEGKSYGYLKNKISDVIVSIIEPIQIKYNKIINEKEYIESIIENGKEKALNIAFQTINEVKMKIKL